MVEVERVELSFQPYQDYVLPLNYTSINDNLLFFHGSHLMSGIQRVTATVVSVLFVPTRVF